MKKFLFCVLLFCGSVTAMAADSSEAELKEKMQKECATLFAQGAECSNLAKGTRNCVRKHLSKATPACVAFEKSNAAFFEAGKNDPIIKK